jgi:hypothetical protein
MKKLCVITSALLLCLAFSMPAMAQPALIANATATADQGNDENDLTGAFLINPSDPASQISGSISGNDGVVGVNQASGVLNNQANVVITAATNSNAILASATATLSQANDLNSEVQLLAISKSAIDGSINTNNGLVGVNQTSGSLNSQANLVAVAAGLGDGPIVAVANAELSQSNAVNGITDLAVIRMDIISDSIQGNSGIVSVNQSAGNLNNQANVLSVAYSE